MQFECTIKIKTEHGEKIAKSLQIDEKENVKYTYDDKQVTMQVKDDNKKHFKKALTSSFDRIMLADDATALFQRLDYNENEM